MAGNIITSSHGSSSTTFTESSTVSVSGKPVGLSWVGGRGEHLLFTSPSQVILYSVQDGSRLREWSFRPTKALAFSIAVRAASAQGLLVGVQGRNKLVAWPDKGSLSAVGGAGAAGGPEGMKSVETTFAVSRLEVNSVGVVWCIGQEDDNLHVACYSTVGKTALTLLASSSSPSSSSSSSAPSSISSCLVHPSKRLLLLLLTNGTLHLYRCPDTAATSSSSSNSSSSSSSKKNQQQTPPLILTTLPPSSLPTLSSLHASGMMWSGIGQETAYLWTVWGGGEGGREGGLFLRMARVAIGREGGRQGGGARMSLIQLYTKTLIDPAAGGAAAAAFSSSSSSASKRRRSSTSSSLASSSSLPPSIQTVGMQAQGLIITAVEEGGREDGMKGGMRLQAWDAEHGVGVGEACPPSSSLSLPSSSSSSLLVGGEGVIASSISSSLPSSSSSSSSEKVVVWSVESKEGGGGGGEGTGLRRALGKLSATTAAATAAATARTAAAAAPLVTMTFKSSEVGWVCQKGGEAAAAAATAAAAAVVGLTPAEAVEELLQLLLAAEQEQQQQQQNGGGKKKEKKSSTSTSTSTTSSRKRKRAKLTGDVLLARTPVAATTALHVASLCLKEEEEGREGGKGTITTKGGKKQQQRRKSSGEDEGGREGGWEERQGGLWRLLLALIEAGKFPLREHPSLLLQLLQRGKNEVVAAALAGPGDLSEKAVVQALHALLRNSPSFLPPSSSVNKGVYVREVSKLVGLAVRRPCCPAFLRAALSEGMDGPTAALLLVLLRSLLEKTMDGSKGGKGGGGEGGREEECVLTWLEALLDAKFVSLVVQGGREGGQRGREGGMVRKVLVGVRECARRGAMACEALELVEGYFAQFKRAGQSLQVIPDYSLESIRI